MDSSIIGTKLYIPQTRSHIVKRSRLIAKLDEGAKNNKLIYSPLQNHTLVSPCDFVLQVYSLQKEVQEEVDESDRMY